MVHVRSTMAYRPVWMVHTSSIVNWYRWYRPIYRFASTIPCVGRSIHDIPTTGRYIGMDRSDEPYHHRFLPILICSEIGVGLLFACWNRYDLGSSTFNFNFSSESGQFFCSFLLSSLTLQKYYSICNDNSACVQFCIKNITSLILPFSDLYLLFAYIYRYLEVSLLCKRDFLIIKCSNNHQNLFVRSQSWKSF